jgi:uncharacterized protein YcgI (DUF1989 family)
MLKPSTPSRPIASSGKLKAARRLPLVRHPAPRPRASPLADLAGRANVSALFYNAEEKLERYNMADTLKAQHTAHLTAGHALYSDMGHVLCSIIQDTCGWHDTVCGTSKAAMVRAKYGESSYQTHRNAMYRNAPRWPAHRTRQVGAGQNATWCLNVNFFQ